MNLLDLLISPAYAQAAAPAASGAAGMMSTLLLPILLLVVMYFIMIRPQIALVLAVADANRAEACEVMAIAGIAGRHHAVEHVDAARDRLHQILRPPHPHEIPRPVRRQLRAGVFEHRIALGFGLADREATDRVTVVADVLQSLRRTRAKLVVQAPLDEAEQRRVVALVRFF